VYRRRPDRDPAGSVAWAGHSPEPLRTFALAGPNAGSERACPAFGVSTPVRGTLAGDPSDPERIWLVGPEGRISVIWPTGFTLVFAPESTLYDEAGRLFAKAGDAIDLGQVRRSSHAGTPADPYLAAGLIDAVGPDGRSSQDCVPAADGTPYADAAPLGSLRIPSPAERWRSRSSGSRAS
jgi:hypothetical protein